MSPSAINSFTDEAKDLSSPHRSFLSRLLGWLITGLWSLVRILLIIWGALAIYYSNLPWASVRLALAGAFAGFAVWACWLTARRGMSAVFLEPFLGAPPRAGGGPIWSNDRCGDASARICRTTVKQRRQAAPDDTLGSPDESHGRPHFPSPSSPQQYTQNDGNAKNQGKRLSFVSEIRHQVSDA